MGWLQRLSEGLTKTRDKVLQSVDRLVGRGPSPEVLEDLEASLISADLGIRMATIGSTLRLMVSGDDEISTYREAGEQYPVKIRVLENQRGDIDQIGRLTVPSAAGPVRIDNIARLDHAVLVGESLRLAW